MHCKENIELSQIPLYIIRYGKELAGQNDLKKIGRGGRGECQEMEARSNWVSDPPKYLDPG